MKEAQLKHFLSVCQNEFQYLIDDYRFTRLPIPEGEFINQFQFILSNEIVTIVIEGVSHGADAVLLIKDNQGHSLGARALMPGWKPSTKFKRTKKLKSQDEQIAESAQLLKIYAQDVLNGDMTRFNQIVEQSNIFIANLLNKNKEK
jgi:hypothetical protein